MKTKSYIWKTNKPVRPHQVGHPLWSLTTPDENINRKSSHLTIYSVMISRGWPDSDDLVGSHGAIIMAKNPVSKSKISLSSRLKIFLLKLCSSKDTKSNHGVNYWLTIETTKIYHRFGIWISTRSIVQPWLKLNHNGYTMTCKINKWFWLGTRLIKIDFVREDAYATADVRIPAMATSSIVWWTFNPSWGARKHRSVALSLTHSSELLLLNCRTALAGVTPEDPYSPEIRINYDFKYNSCQNTNPNTLNKHKLHQFIVKSGSSGKKTSTTYPPFASRSTGRPRSIRQKGV